MKTGKQRAKAVEANKIKVKQWSKPKAQTIRLGFEVTLYVYRDSGKH